MNLFRVIAVDILLILLIPSSYIVDDLETHHNCNWLFLIYLCIWIGGIVFLRHLIKGKQQNKRDKFIKIISIIIAGCATVYMIRIGLITLFIYELVNGMFFPS